MKPNILQRWKTRLFPPGRKQRRGVAILTVLSIITLMTILVISFFNMSQTHQATSKGTVELQRVQTIRDTIINLVIAQVREATTLEGNTADQMVAWTSQPGAIRTYSRSDVTRNKLYKLYSSNEPQLEGIRPKDSKSLLDDIKKDLVSDWDMRPDEFVDINRPVFTAASGSRAVDAKKDQEHFSYPIADPRRWNGNENDTTINTEGFKYKASVEGVTMNGVDPKRLQLAFPVRWIYILRDGSLGYLNSTGEFTALTGKDGRATVTNPIVGRMAWWADDESCKVNVNTASVPSVWDTPRTTSLEDKWLAQRQPLAGEFQRYPGHPATTDISAVLFPGKRFTPDPSLIPVGTVVNSPPMQVMDLQREAMLLWDIAPYISSGNGDSSGGGTLGGTQLRPGNALATSFQAEDHLFTSFDEVYFKALSSSGASTSANTPRNNLLNEGLDANKQFLTRLEQSQFFLTHKSHSPETTMHGFPRISMFPMHTSAVAMLNQTSANINFGTGEVSPYDLSLAINSTIGKKAYYFQRNDPNSRHGEFYSNTRNVRIAGYLKELTKLAIPGYPETKPVALNGYNEDLYSLAAKYPPAFNVNTGSRFISQQAGSAVEGGPGLQLDASDRTQILLSMLDYTRSINMNPGLATTKYDNGNGQSTGICGCCYVGGDFNATHTNMMDLSKVSAKNTRTPKGYGRLPVASEISMIVNIAAMRAPNSTANVGDALSANDLDSFSAEMWNDANDPRARYLVEVGFIMSSFTPKMGWAPVLTTGGIAISSRRAASGTALPSPAAPAGSQALVAADTSIDYQLPFVATINHKNNQSIYLTAGARRNGWYYENNPRWMPGTGGTSPKAFDGLIPAGGATGPRAAMKNAIALCKPFVFANTSASGAPQVQLAPAITTDERRRLIIYQYDNGPGDFNVTNQIELEVPTNFSISTPTLTEKSLQNTASLNAWFGQPDIAPNAAAASGAVAGTPAFPDPRWCIRSWVLPHGDYRIIAGSLRTEAGTYVYSDTSTGSMAHAWWEPTFDPTRRKALGATYNTTVTAFDDKTMQGYGNRNDFNMGMAPALPFGKADPAAFLEAKQPLPAWGKAGFVGTAAPFSAVYDSSSRDPMNTGRREIFSHGRLDGRNQSMNRGSSDPGETNDFDNGLADLPDGPYLGWPDEGDLRNNRKDGYFGLKNIITQKTAQITGQTISPNFLVHSPVDFGSIPTGVQARVPWQTLRFRPDTGMATEGLQMSSLTSKPPAGMPFANFCGPRDHFFLDLFWMPVVEPWSISEPFSTKGTINLNQQIFPFMYVERTTGLYALFRGERILAIPNDAADRYKSPNNNDPTYRYFINPRETVRQFEMRYRGETYDNAGVIVQNGAAFNTYRSATEICETWLVPEKNGNAYDGTLPWDLEHVMGVMPDPTNGAITGFWENHKRTGDNSRERPYSNLYPRVTTRSNVFRIHMVAQALQKAKSTEPTKFDSTKDAVTGEWRGSAIIERSVDANDPELAGTGTTGAGGIDYLRLNSQSLSNTITPRVDRFYIYRVTELKQLTE